MPDDGDGEAPMLGAGSSPADASAAAKIIKYYQRHDPSKASLEHVDWLLSKYTFSQIEKGLEKKYTAIIWG